MPSRKRTVEVEVVVDDQQAQRNLQNIDSAVTKTSKTFSNAAKVVGGFMAGSRVLDFANEAIGAFSELEQSVGGTEAVFGRARGVIDEFADNSAESLGLAEAEFRTATTSIGGQLKRMTGDVELAAEQSVVLTGVAADLAATYGGTTAEAVNALGAAFRGEADPAERFNLNLKIGKQNAKAVELGLAETTSAVDDNARAQALLALIMEQSADAQGQFAREADTVSGALQRQEAAAKDSQAAVGEYLAPFKLELNEIAADIVAIGDGLAQLGGNNTSGFDDLVDNMFDFAPVLGEVKSLLSGFADLFDDADQETKEWSLSTEDMENHAAALENELSILQGTTDDVTESNETSEASVKAMAEALEFEAERADRARKALREKHDTLRELHNPLFRAVELVDDLAEAEKAVDEAIKPEDFKEAVIARAKVIADLKDTVLELKEDGIDPTGSAARQMLTEMGIPQSVIDDIFSDIQSIEDRIEGSNPRMTVDMFLNPAELPSNIRSSSGGGNTVINNNSYHSVGTTTLQELNELNRRNIR